jgi:hypothetical protein
MDVLEEFTITELDDCESILEEEVSIFEHETISNKDKTIKFDFFIIIISFLI